MERRSALGAAVERLHQRSLPEIDRRVIPGDYFPRYFTTASVRVRTWSFL